MPVSDYEKILFNLVVAITAIIRISETHVQIIDSDGTQHSFNGGSRDYEITVQEHGTSKKNSNKVITIRKKKPLCPITSEPFDPKKGLKFKSLFALNTVSVHIRNWYNDALKPCYVAELFNTTSGHTIFAAVKVIDHRKLTPLDTEALLQDLPINVVDQIASEHQGFIDTERTNYNFSMSTRFPIELDTVYSLKGILHLINEGILDLCMSSRPIVYDPFSGYVICRLTETSYNYVFPNGNLSYLTNIFSNFDQMLEYRQKMLNTIQTRADV
jgi:hypothetical protein